MTVLHYKSSNEVKRWSTNSLLGPIDSAFRSTRASLDPFPHTTAVGTRKSHCSFRWLSCQGTVQTAQVHSQIKQSLELQRTPPQMEHSCPTWEWWGPELASMAEGCDLSQYLLEKELAGHTHFRGKGKGGVLNSQRSLLGASKFQIHRFRGVRLTCRPKSRAHAQQSDLIKALSPQAPVCEFTTHRPWRGQESPCLTLVRPGTEGFCCTEISRAELALALSDFAP